MPFGTFIKVREVSSEDKHNLAESLIRPHSGKKWKTENVGEKSAYVILEMNEAQQITGIDIGNEHSAYIEVLVGKYSCLPSDFKEILLTCSFMTPIESRSSNNINRVRCFNESALVTAQAENEWSLVKIICTQPFNKHVQYGLSFIKVHVANKPPSVTKTPSQTLIEKGHSHMLQEVAKPISRIGSFMLREDSPDLESEGPSNLFNRWKKTREERFEQTSAASIRAASSTVLVKPTTISIPRKPNEITKSESLEIPDRNRDTLIFGDEDDIDEDKKVRLSKKVETDKQRRVTELQQQSNNNIRSLEMKNTTRDNNVRNKTNTNAPTASSKDLDAIKRRHSSPNESERPSKKEKPPLKRYKPFNQLLSGVVLVISGIQNPDRSDLRSKALALGANYKGDWDSTCTHLICAFKNTPKYNQVRGKGKIITRTWIEKCYSSKKYLPWRRYALDSQELTKPESDEEILDESLKPYNYSDSPNTSRNSTERSNKTLYLYDMDNHPFMDALGEQSLGELSQSDTDDEIQRIEKMKKLDKHEQEKRKVSKNRSKECNDTVDKSDVYDLPTDEEDYLQCKLNQ